MPTAPILECKTGKKKLTLTQNIDKDNQEFVTRRYDKKDDSNFPVDNFPFSSINIPLAPLYGVYVPLLVRSARAYCSYQDFVDRAKLFTSKFIVTRLS